MAAAQDAGPIRGLASRRHREPLGCDRGQGNQIPQGPRTTKGANPYRARTSSSCVRMWWCSARSVHFSSNLKSYPCFIRVNPWLNQMNLPHCEITEQIIGAAFDETRM